MLMRLSACNPPAETPFRLLVARGATSNFGAHQQNRGIRGLILFFPNEKM